jgi:hypothetical protein
MRSVAIAFVALLSVALGAPAPAPNAELAARQGCFMALGGCNNICSGGSDYLLCSRSYVSALPYLKPRGFLATAVSQRKNID